MATTASQIGVIWDLGNVLIDWHPHSAIAAGVGDQEATRFLAADDFDFMAYNHGPDAGMTWADAEAVLAVTHPHWLSHATAYREHFADSLLGEVPGSVDILRTLHAASIPMWGLTNWSHELYPNAPAMFDFLRLLEDVVVSGTEGVAKPDPRIFELAVTRAGLLPEALVFIDDRADNVEAAIAGGLDGIRFVGADDLRTQLRARGLIT